MTSVDPDTMSTAPPATLLTEQAPFVRDAVNLRRIMVTVLIALIPVFLMACFNTGYQANLAISRDGMDPFPGWREYVLGLLGTSFDPHNFAAAFLRGAFWVVPALVMSFVVGGICEWICCRIRGLTFNESFWVTAALFGLALPVEIPLWKAAIGLCFGIVFCKYAFGGAGFNVFNTMLVGRGFLFFSFPNHFSGTEPYAAVDAYSNATPLTIVGSESFDTLRETYTWFEAFVGLTPGSLGETSAAACLLGAIILLGSGVASWRIMLGILVGVIVSSGLLNLIGSSTNTSFAMPFWWHLVIGSIAFGGVFMATDPVTAPATPMGRLIYGFLIGIMIIGIRCLNPAYTEGTLLSILFLNTFASLIDHGVVRWHIRKRRRALA